MLEKFFDVTIDGWVVFRDWFLCICLSIIITISVIAGMWVGYRAASDIEFQCQSKAPIYLQIKQPTGIKKYNCFDAEKQKEDKNEKE